MLASFLTYPEIDPVLIHLGPVAIRWYAISYISGLLLGWWLIVKMLRQASLWKNPPFKGKAPATVRVDLLGGHSVRRDRLVVLFLEPSTTRSSAPLPQPTLAGVSPSNPGGASPMPGSGVGTAGPYRYRFNGSPAVVAPLPVGMTADQVHLH